MRRSVPTRLAAPLAAILLAAPLAATPARATPYQFTFTTTSFISSIPGTGSGISITIMADNGGNSMLGQSWTEADILSASLVSGSYSASYTGPYLTASFVTNGSGALTTASFLGSQNGNGTDSLGSGGIMALNFNAAISSQGGILAFQQTMTQPSALANWSGPVAVVTAVPEPATMALLGAGLAGLAAARRRRAA